MSFRQKFVKHYGGNSGSKCLSRHKICHCGKCITCFKCKCIRKKCCIGKQGKQGPTGICECLEDLLKKMVEVLQKPVGPEGPAGPAGIAAIAGIAGPAGIV